MTSSTSSNHPETETETESKEHSILNLRPEPNSFEEKYWLTDEQLDALGIQKTRQHIFRERRFLQAYDLPCWYDALKEHTFATHILNLSRDECWALVHSYVIRQFNLSQLPTPIHDMSFSASDNKEALIFMESKGNEILKSLQKRIDTVAPRVFFVKLGGRSPKDVPFSRDYFHSTNIQKTMDSILTRFNVTTKVKQASPTTNDESIETPSSSSSSSSGAPPPPPSLSILSSKPKTKFNNTSHYGTLDPILTSKIILEFSRVFASECKLNRENVIPFLSSSQRIYEDLISEVSAFQKGDTNTTSFTTLAIREWKDAVIDNLEYEFRCFAVDKKLTAITQYYVIGEIPQLISKKDPLFAKMTQFFIEIISQIPHNSFIIDFLVTPEKIYVIELNPIYQGAGAGCFSWKQDSDILLGKGKGKGKSSNDCEFRLLKLQPKTTSSDLFRIFPHHWRQWLQNKL